MGCRTKHADAVDLKELKGSRGAGVGRAIQLETRKSHITHRPLDVTLHVTSPPAPPCVLQVLPAQAAPCEEGQRPDHRHQRGAFTVCVPLIAEFRDAAGGCMPLLRRDRRTLHLVSCFVLSLGLLMLPMY